MSVVPEWAMQLFCDRAGLNYDVILASNSENGVVLRAAIKEGGRTIAKHEQPPVDPDVEAVKRILLSFYGSPVILGEDAVARAVAQYKQERGQ